MSLQKTDVLAILQKVGAAALQIEHSLFQLDTLENEAFGESDFNKSNNTGDRDPAEILDALELISDEAVSVSRRVSERLTEARLELGEVLLLLKSDDMEGGE